METIDDFDPMAPRLLVDTDKIGVAADGTVEILRTELGELLTWIAGHHADLGIQQADVSGLVTALAGKLDLTGGTLSGGLTVSIAGGNGFLEAKGETGANFFTTLYAAASSSGPRFLLRRSAGTIASPAGIANGDVLGTFGYQGAHIAGAYRNAVSLISTVTEPTPTSAMGSRFRIDICAVGATSPTEAIRLEHATGLSMFGANPVIDQNRIIRHRLYTIATLPAASTCPNGEAMVSDPAGGKGRLVWNDGSSWYYASDASAV